MCSAPNPERSSATLAEAFSEFLRSLRGSSRLSHERYVRHYVESTGEDLPVAAITGPRVESYASSYIKNNDPLAAARVAALKAWFQYLKKHNYTDQNFGTVIRLKRAGRSRAKAREAAEKRPLEVTAAGLAEMKQELHELERQVPQLIEMIAEAREDKDFRENAPLEAAREALAQNQSRRKRLQDDIQRAQVVDHDGAGERASLGSAVTVTRLDNGKQFTYKLVTPREANVREGKISIESPVGSGLVGKAVGEEATVATPGGEVVFRIDGIAGS